MSRLPGRPVLLFVSVSWPLSGVPRTTLMAVRMPTTPEPQHQPATTWTPTGTGSTTPTDDSPWLGIILAVALAVAAATLWLVAILALGYEGDVEQGPETITQTTDTIQPMRGRAQ